MDYARFDLIRLEHRHGRDDWHRMDEVDSPAAHDAEREWARHRIFRCTTCEDEIRIDAPEPAAS